MKFNPDSVSLDNIPTDQLNEETLQTLVPPIQIDNPFSNCIIVDNLPIVPPEKYDRLKGVIEKIFTNVGPIVKDGFYLPKDPETEMTTGFGFIEFVDTKTAVAAKEKLDGARLDKSHVFKVNFYNDFETIAKLPDQYEPPSSDTSSHWENLRWWLLDDKHKAGDQSVVRYGDETEIYWNDPNKKPELLYKKKNWTDTFIAWSPLGSYLVTFHVQGVILWGGESWKKLNKFSHPGVKLIDFSPKENFLVTLSSQSQSVFIWETKTSRKLREFQADSSAWPFFKWSFDDKYFARMQKEAIHVWETPSMSLLEKKAIKIPSVKDFCWSPSQSIISCWVPEINDAPARVILLEIPSRKEKKTKNIFSVNECKMHWHPKGDYLCVKVDRYAKKQTYVNFEIFRMKEKDVPIEVLEMKQHIVAFAWEPNGNRFAIIHSADSTSRPDVSFYSMQDKQYKHIKTLEKKSANHLFWSPRGEYIVLANFQNGQLEFFDVNEMETLATAEHPMMTDLEWDPSGRYVVTASSAWRHQLENGYCIWSFQGKQIIKVLKDKFYQFLWRPRPLSLLSEEKEQEIKKNLSTYSKRYTAEDRQAVLQEVRERKRQRRAIRKEWEDYITQRRREYLQQESERRILRGGRPEVDEADYEYVTRELPNTD